MSRPFVARFPGPCAICERRINPGEWVTYTEDDEIAHDTCDRNGRDYVEVLRDRPVCTVCSLTKPCFCEEDA